MLLLMWLGGGREGARLKYALHWREEELGHASSHVFTTCGRRRRRRLLCVAVVSRSLGWSISVARVVVVLLAVFGVIAAFACWRISLKR